MSWLSVCFVVVVHFAILISRSNSFSIARSRRKIRASINSLSSTAAPSAAEEAISTLASTTVAMLAGDEQSAKSLAGDSSNKRKMIQDAFAAYDVCESGTLSVEEAQALFTNLARSIVEELATTSEITAVAQAHARRVLAADEAGDTIGRVATKLLMLADADHDGKISLPELAEMFETVHNAGKGGPKMTFPQPLRALAGSLQLLPPSEAAAFSTRAEEWHLGVPGDDHTLRQVSLEDDRLTLVGLGRSADASAYFVPELGIVFDAGIHVKSLLPKTVLLTHGHRDHIAALPTFANSNGICKRILVPAQIESLVSRFLLAEAQLNYGDPTQTDEATMEALNFPSIEGVEDGMSIQLDKDSYAGSPTPLGVQVIRAPHKTGVPAVSYGLYRVKNRLRPEYATLEKHELGKLLQDSNNTIDITESYEEGILFYSGDTTIDLLRNRWKEILPKYKHFIHEVTFLGMPSKEIDASSQQKGHTHYAQLHPWIAAFPETSFICVHWSLRYSKEDILRFFSEQYGGVPKNVVLWI
mmetsp:Transcript_12420/g.19122  ORF Transcript_12420/g.19122 Transcript_12420/m.19122 type:complete len:528 (+) Transcript_12420:118-1701(+)|eukprot:CAMPEP_0178926006 /NCGR_PEP_ID=MMETSP0786-20121207/18260_1 /TAXON_ID=186022 /ORGANISM="Thalassionema frauenfeldii, Strain CCMP 1798" /LENGTH=527 /DNA_ID=CAMNT_0020601015 /DNA_START=111 /DNA_END=1694 /DNA_ORIENTATION=-